MYRTAVLILALCLTGCVQHQYFLTDPGPERLIPEKDTALVVTINPLEYHLQQLEDYLYVGVVNTSDQVINVIPERSYIVDPQGESHTVRLSILPPHARSSMVIPPMPHVHHYAGYGPGWYGGGWYGYGGPWRHYSFGYDPYWYYGPPDYYVTVPGPDSWEWRTGPVKMVIAYRQGNSMLEHHLEILRRRK